MLSKHSSLFLRLYLFGPEKKGTRIIDSRTKEPCVLWHILSRYPKIHLLNEMILQTAKESIKRIICPVCYTHIFFVRCLKIQIHNGKTI